MTTENERLEPLPIDDTTQVTQRFNRPKVVEQEWSIQTGPIGKNGQEHDRRPSGCQQQIIAI
jgi:hypothetical protein